MAPRLLGAITAIQLAVALLFSFLDRRKPIANSGLHRKWETVQSEVIMIEMNGSAISICLGTCAGQCVLRAAQLGLGLADGGARDAAVGDLRCRRALRLFCPDAPLKPSFDGRDLRVGDEVLKRFKKGGGGKRNCWRRSRRRAGRRRSSNRSTTTSTHWVPNTAIETLFPI
jgi:hypothetical protein